MATSIYRVCKRSEYQKAGPTDLIELLPVPGGHPLFLPKWIIEVVVNGIVSHEFIHLSGPTGTAKSSLLEALHRVPENFQRVCEALGLPARALNLYPVEMVVFEAPGELYQRRSLKDGTTFDEKSILVDALQNAGEAEGRFYPLIWLREIGRVHSSSVQGGLLNLMTKGDIVLPDGSRIRGQAIAWVADSNYQAEQDSNHTLVTFDDALKRRFCIHVTLDYLPAEQEVEVLRQILKGEKPSGRIDPGLIVKVVELGNAIRQHRSEGKLRSIAPPTIYGYLAFLRAAQTLSHLSIQQIAQATMLGNAGVDDRKHAAGVLNSVFGIHGDPEEDVEMGVGNLF